jgi:glycosyltransferase involved in cell wall biosynthesis
MSRIVVVGRGAMPWEGSSYQSAHGLRTDQFVRGLAAAGNVLKVLLVDVRDTSCAVPPPPELGDTVFERLRPEASRDARALESQIRDFDPDGIVAVTALASYLVSRTAIESPLWMDLNGDSMAEAQALAVARNDDECLDDYWWANYWCLLRGDAFSTVSAPQRFSLLGQLSLVGRNARRNAFPSLVSRIFEIAELALTPISELGDRRAILLSGSFNSWIDVNSLAKAIDIVLSTEPTSTLEVTGGEVDGFQLPGWSRFRSDLENASYGDRVKFRGWISPQELELVERDAFCGVVAERPLLERELGSLNRTLRWMARGVPVVTTGLCELGRMISDQQLGLTYTVGDPVSLAQSILRLYRDRQLAEEMAARAMEWVRSRRTVTETVRPLIEWAKSPRPAPDRAAGDLPSLVGRFRNIVDSQARESEKDLAALRGEPPR